MDAQPTVAAHGTNGSPATASHGGVEPEGGWTPEAQAALLHGPPGWAPWAGRQAVARPFETLDELRAHLRLSLKNLNGWCAIFKRDGNWSLYWSAEGKRQAFHGLLMDLGEPLDTLLRASEECSSFAIEGEPGVTKEG